MRLIPPSFYIEDSTGDPLKDIEIAGRVSYKSEDKITPDSAEKFISMLINRGHMAPLEFGTVYLTIPVDLESYYYNFYKRNPYSRAKVDNGMLYVTTNYRVYDSYCKPVEPTKWHPKRITVRFKCSRAIANELVRHRAFSFCQESTRYCNYSKDKFNNEITFILPLKPGKLLFESLETAEKAYMDLIKLGLKAQEARDILPLATKTELMMCGFVSQWKEFFKLRASNAGAKGVHPEMLRIINPLYQEFLERKLIVPINRINDELER